MTECTTVASPASDTLLDCASRTQPTNEPAIAIDPSDPSHIVVGANDMKGGQFPPPGTQFYTTFDGGKTWSTGDLSRGPGQQIGVDPSIAFDEKHGTVIYATVVAATAAQGCGGLSGAISTDGGLHWRPPVVVAHNFGCDGSFPSGGYDGEWITTDNDLTSPSYGRTYAIALKIVCTAPDCDPASGTGRFAIIESHSDDGGYTWTPVQEISGSSTRYCTAPPGPPSCANDDAEPRIAVSSDGSVHVAFLNVQNTSAWEDGECCEFQWLVVNSIDGGATWSAPVHVADLEDGSRDLPNCYVSGGYPACSLTGTGLGVGKPGVGAKGNLVANLSDGSLYLIFADNRNGTHDVADPVSNMDVFVMTSTDGGSRWYGPDVVSGSPGDQWSPFAAVNPVTGQLGVLFDDRSYGNGSTFDLTLATGLPGHFTSTRISTKSSHLKDNLWFPAGIHGCEKCVSWIGEFLGIAYDADGTARMVWTDLRRKVSGGRRAGYTENIFFATS